MHYRLYALSADCPTAMKGTESTDPNQGHHPSTSFVYDRTQRKGLNPLNTS